MRISSVVIVVTLVVTGMVLATPVMGVAPLAQGTTDSDEGGFGTELTAFSQSTAASVNSSIDSGLWEVAVERSADPTEAVTKRATQLEQRLERLERRSAEVNRTARNGTAYQATASAVRGEILALKTAINRTKETAQRAGVNETRLTDLGSKASKLRGPEVAERARNITDAPRGPPDHAGPNGTDPGEGGPPENGTDRGPPETGTDRGPPENGTDRGPPDDAGPGSSGDNAGPPGNGSDAGPPDNSTETGSSDDDTDANPPDDTDPGPPENDTDAGPPDNTEPPENSK